MIPLAQRPSGRAAGEVAVDVLVDDWPATPRPVDVALLGERDLRRMREFERPRDAAGFAAARALVRFAAAARLGCRPEDVPLVTEPWRPPRIDREPLACSIARGGGMIVVAVAELEAIGVDVEPDDPGISPTEIGAIARQVLGLSRAEVGAMLASGDSVREFLTRWTLTEAVLKSLGTGLSGDPRQVRLDLQGVPRLRSAPGLSTVEAASWQVHRLRVGPGHVAALASSRACRPHVRRRPR